MTVRQGDLAAPVLDGSLGDRAARIFEFLVDLQRLRTKVVRSLESYRSVVWFFELPDGEGLHTAETLGDSSVWLAVDRVERALPPPPPDELRPWLSERALRDSSQSLPALSARTMRAVEVINEDGDRETFTEELLLQDHPEVSAALELWAPVWRVWADEDRPRAAVARVYHRLYAMYQESRALAETYEVVLGLGALATTSGGQFVHRHLITAPATIDLDLDTGRLSVIPSPDAGPPALEQDMLDPEDTVPDDTRQAIREMLLKLDDPWAADPAGAHQALRTWVNSSGADAAYDPAATTALVSANAAAPTTVAFAPALILRERTRRSFIGAGERIIEALRAGGAVPTGVRQFAQIADGRVSQAEQITWNSAYADEEIYFPKPANEEQRQIRQRLADHQTVVVQGPPGTGKTHTIANLITDLLAHGQRVLITSTTTRALKVLKDKLPVEISELCVSVTDDAVKGQADLERSVKALLAQADSWNQANADAEAALLRRRLTKARNSAHNATQELRSVREQETYVYTADIGDYTGTLQQIAARLAEEEKELSWIGPVPGDEPTLTQCDLTGYLRLLRQVTPAVRALAGPAPGVADLPTPPMVAALAERRGELLRRGQQLVETPSTAEYHALAGVTEAERRQIRTALSDLVRRQHELNRRREHWVASAMQDVASGRDRFWRQRHQDTAAVVASAPGWLSWAQGHVVSGLDELDFATALGHARALVEHVSTGGKLKGVLGRTKQAKAGAPLLDRVRVDGRPCDDLDQLRIVQSHLVLESVLEPLERAWGYPSQRHMPHPQRVAQLEDEIRVLADVLNFGDAISALERQLAEVPGMPGIDPITADDAERLERALVALDLAQLRDQIQQDVAPAVDVLAAFAGRPRSPAAHAQARDALRAWDAPGYHSAYTGIQQTWEANTLTAELEKRRALVAAALPELAEAVAATPDDPVWEQRFERLPQAWAWSAWEARLRSKTNPAAERHWRQVLSEADADERATLQKLAANRGWTHALARLSPSESTHLKMYAQAVRKVGKGTGKYVARYREAARSSLRQAQSAVPAWIMPMHQVFDTVPVDQPDLFDVVIVDEASQSGLEGLLLSWLAPRMVVVGDDKQLSPADVGIDHEAIFTLQDRYLAPLEHRSLFAPLSSFFDLAVGMSTSRIMLREHFRCMPEIIGFSNELCYGGELLPLRQYGADRLPPLRTTYVKGALVSSRRDVINEAEADAIIDQVEKCCADPTYDGKTMGVITMLGNAQDKLITQRLVDTLGVRVVEERHLRAGNAEAFQGDERDVIFISLVSSLQSTVGPARIGPLSKDSDQRRLNVAASRARDQVWLFHSVHPGDLSAKDLRRRYLQYLLKPPTEQDGLDIGEVLPDERHPAFDSLFEQRVFLAIRGRGYRVRPQVRVGGYRIDLVIEGGTRRLAVECDGDAFHDDETLFDDAARQRDLERMGWTFWRVRGSTFHRDPQTAMSPLWEVLDRLDIQPSWPERHLQDTAAHSEVDAALSPEPEATDDLLDDLLSATDDVPTAPTAKEGETQPRLPTSSTATPGRGAKEPVPRFRNGKVLLSLSAHQRMQHEVTSIRQWLANPPEVHAVDARSLEVQRAKQANHREELEDRLSHLDRVLAQAVLDAHHPGGDWVTPGSAVRVRYPSQRETEVLVVSSMPLAQTDNPEITVISPFTELAQAVEGAAVGSILRFNTPRGLQQATVVQVLD